MIQQKNRKKYIVFILFLFLLAIFIRTFRFGEIPGGMNQDGAMAAVDAKALAFYGTDRLGMRFPVHLTAWKFGQMSALLSYLMAPVIRLFGLSVTAVRIPSLIISLCGLAALFLFSRKAFGNEYAAGILFFAAINPWHIIQSRWALDCNLFPHFLMFGICCLYLGTKKTLYYYVSMIFFGLSMYCYGISLYTVPLFLLASCIYLLAKKEITIRKILICAAVYFLVSWPFFVCMFINWLGLDTIDTPFFTIPYFPDTIRSSDILFFSDHPLKQLSENFLSTLRILCQTYNWSICNEVKGFGTMYSVSIPFMLIGAILSFRQFRKNTGSAFVVFLFLTGILDGLITSNVNINRLNLIFYALIIFSGTGIYRTALFLKSGFTSSAAKFYLSVITAVYLTVFSLFSWNYFTSYAAEVSDTFMEDFGNALTAVKDADTEHYCITPDAQYPGFWYVSEVLTLFWHDIDADFYQSDDFSSKYAFRNPEPDEHPDGSSVYVLTADYADFFADSNYYLTQYGRFLTAVPSFVS